MLNPSLLVITELLYRNKYFVPVKSIQMVRLVCFNVLKQNINIVEAVKSVSQTTDNEIINPQNTFNFQQTIPAVLLCNFDSLLLNFWEVQWLIILKWRYTLVTDVLK
jgi:hypothetical protein